MSKRTERMSRSAAEIINRKDTVIRQNNAELEELRSQYDNLDICEEDKQVIVSEAVKPISSRFSGKLKNLWMRVIQ